METATKPGKEAAKLIEEVLPKAQAQAPRQSLRAQAIIGAVVLAAAGSTGFVWANRNWETTDDANIEGHVVAVSPRVAGHIVRLLIDDNQIVKKGELLAEIDPRDYETKRDNARAAVNGAEAAVRKTQLDLERFQRLAPQGAAPRQSLDNASADAQSARAALESARAVLRQAELDLSYTRITAPQAGRVTRRTVEEGAYVGVGQSLLALVPTDVWVVANFKETQLRKMRPGDRAEMTIDAYKGKIAGHVDSLQAGTGARFSVLPAENATGNFVKVVQRMPVKIVLDQTADAQKLLAPGMSVEAEVEVR